ncbi:MAG: alpha/beta hydrolase-fold protein [Bacteroidetes bacterium]|nr:alpha/beta hydrolase-fold protein [Bacteroidota bacterium]
MKRSVLSLLFSMVSFFCISQLPVVSSGSIARLENFQSKYITPRNIDIWLPEGYNAAKKYSVLYMHDGQMLYDTATTWNRQSWDVDDVLAKLMKEKKIRNVIVVGVWNGGNTRHGDYFPQKPFESLTTMQQDSLYLSERPGGASIFNNVKVNSDNYLKFIVSELKPYIDKNYPTRKDRADTFIAGSSMGGLISLYAICEYPKVFGGAACLSTHWPGIFTLENNPTPAAFIKYLKTHLPDPASHRIYFDYGTETLDAMYPAIQKEVDTVMKSSGFTSKNWITREFKGETHSEKSWNKRLMIPMIFLLGR